MTSPYLDLLARVLATAGWSSRPRYEQDPARLHVYSPCLPSIGESVHVKPGVGGVPWFIASTGDPIAPCHDLEGAVAEIGRRLEPWVTFAAAYRAASRPDETRARRSLGRLLTAFGMWWRPDGSARTGG
ncbi:hypothetical protein AGRA3207_006093 [Actinomadura graeca]|uniref:Uncharacterized protein n=1 Tax=Actinomadura graeca TaxID=2750812 RepID=A0ABX8R6V5_9ACTN|nr:hypothetical protein [Actinomadura graeca]QXJ24713.1 hypothetical protein AGRA3207_006093 [Actinomadura graeca]